MRLTALALVVTSALLVSREAVLESARPKVGEPAPAFRLNDHTGQATAVGGAAQGWTVVAFYPKALTPG